MGATGAATATGELLERVPDPAEEGIGVSDRFLGESPLERFLSELRQMSSAERVRASRYAFSRWERSVWAARYPEEVPLVNGEFEWIALRLT
jgi:hypothetical protein